MKCLLTNESSNSFSEKIIRKVEDAKHNAQWRKHFMEFERQLAYSFREGKAEGMEEKAVEASLEFLKKGVSPEIIAECVKLPLEKVLELQKELMSQS